MSCPKLLGGTYEYFILNRYAYSISWGKSLSNIPLFGHAVLVVADNNSNCCLAN